MVMEMKTMCAWCKRIRTPGEKWHTPVDKPDLRTLNHGICMKCAVEFFGTTEDQLVGFDPEGEIMKPIRKKCRIKPIPGISKLARCLEPNAQTCTHGLVLHYGVLCRHPQWQQMMIEDQGG